jgi:FkbM family methyltransferase
MPAPEPGSYFKSLEILFKNGVRFSTIIDVGCADGHFFLSLMVSGIAEGARPLNIDPNPIYEESLRNISDVAGGHFRTFAITDHEGEVELTMAAHPYWASLRPKGDLYWDRINKLTEAPIKVPATTLDTLREQLALTPPFLLKLDVQGAEAAVLRGAANVLKDTHVVICEADIDDFNTLNSILNNSGFELYDITMLNYVGSGRLGFFYPVYISRELAASQPEAFWEAKDNDAIIRMQFERRKAVMKWNAETLAGIKKSRDPTSQPPSTQISRNAPCPCGSGKRYKHCHGAALP